MVVPHTTATAVASAASSSSSASPSSKESLTRSLQILDAATLLQIQNNNKKNMSPLSLTDEAMLVQAPPLQYKRGMFLPVGGPNEGKSAYMRNISIINKRLYLASFGFTDRMPSSFSSPSSVFSNPDGCFEEGTGIRKSIPNATATMNTPLPSAHITSSAVSMSRSRYCRLRSAGGYDLGERDFDRKKMPRRPLHPCDRSSASSSTTSTATSPPSPSSVSSSSFSSSSSPLQERTAYWSKVLLLAAALQKNERTPSTGIMVGGGGGGRRQEGDGHKDVSVDTRDDEKEEEEDAGSLFGGFVDDDRVLENIFVALHLPHDATASLWTRTRIVAADASLSSSLSSTYSSSSSASKMRRHRRHITKLFNALMMTLWEVGGGAAVSKEGGLLEENTTPISLETLLIKGTNTTTPLLSSSSEVAAVAASALQQEIVRLRTCFQTIHRPMILTLLEKWFPFMIIGAGSAKEEGTTTSTSTSLQAESTSPSSSPYSFSSSSSSSSSRWYAALHRRLLLCVYYPQYYCHAWKKDMQPAGNINNGLEKKNEDDEKEKVPQRAFPLTTAALKKHVYSRFDVSLIAIAGQEAATTIERIEAAAMTTHREEGRGGGGGEVNERQEKKKEKRTGIIEEEKDHHRPPVEDCPLPPQRSRRHNTNVPSTSSSLGAGHRRPLYDWVMWMDSDVIITNASIPPEAIIFNTLFRQHADPRRRHHRTSHRHDGSSGSSDSGSSDAGDAAASKRSQQWLRLLFADAPTTRGEEGNVHPYLHPPAANTRTNALDDFNYGNVLIDMRAPFEDLHPDDDFNGSNNNKDKDNNAGKNIEEVMNDPLPNNEGGGEEADASSFDRMLSATDSASILPLHIRSEGDLRIHDMAESLGGMPSMMLPVPDPRRLPRGAQMIHMRGHWNNRLFSPKYLSEPFYNTRLLPFVPRFTGSLLSRDSQRFFREPYSHWMHAHVLKLLYSSSSSTASGTPESVAGRLASYLQALYHQTRANGSKNGIPNQQDIVEVEVEEAASSKRNSNNRNDLFEFNYAQATILFKGGGSGGGGGSSRRGGGKSGGGGSNNSPTSLVKHYDAAFVDPGRVLFFGGGMDSRTRHEEAQKQQQLLSSSTVVQGDAINNKDTMMKTKKSILAAVESSAEEIAVNANGMPMGALSSHGDTALFDAPTVADFFSIATAITEALFLLEVPVFQTSEQRQQKHTIDSNTTVDRRMMIRLLEKSACWRRFILPFFLGGANAGSDSSSPGARYSCGSLCHDVAGLLGRDITVRPRLPPSERLALRQKLTAILATLSHVFSTRPVAAAAAAAAAAVAAGNRDAVGRMTTAVGNAISGGDRSGRNALAITGGAPLSSSSSSSSSTPQMITSVDNDPTDAEKTKAKEKEERKQVRGASPSTASSSAHSSSNGHADHADNDDGDDDDSDSFFSPTYDIIASSQSSIVNNGVFFLQNTPWVRDYWLPLWWHAPPRTWMWHDNGAFIHTFAESLVGSEQAHRNRRHLAQVPARILNSFYRGSRHSAKGEKYIADRLKKIVGFGLQYHQPGDFNIHFPTFGPYDLQSRFFCEALRRHKWQWLHNIFRHRSHLEHKLLLKSDFYDIFESTQFSEEKEVNGVTEKHHAVDARRRIRVVPTVSLERYPLSAQCRQDMMDLQRAAMDLDL